VRSESDDVDAGASGGSGDGAVRLMGGMTSVSMDRGPGISNGGGSCGAETSGRGDVAPKGRERGEGSGTATRQKVLETG
jgi:hypothetical protein